ncbi:PorT family protein [Chitinophaga agrisoli]|uniref:PorT family protein n=1 Tax=Chitinophaga agrisoli TaxID=2607653 RepID=A0A5B2W094_9BACT|nr:PorT family protein [Chitinophaga agrisoli]KAA2244524.1 PorT family protein [Chitinophaga agrisoli]
MRKHCTLLFLIACLLSLRVAAQEKGTDSTKKDWTKHVFGEYAGGKTHRVYVSWGGDGPLLSFANVKDNGAHVRNIPRFTVFANVGTNFNYDLSNSFGLFTGINIKNIGLITEANDSLKLKRRVYTVGIPLGFKIGDLRRGNIFFFAGGSYDLAVNYKEKQFVNGDKRHKFNEWFSDRTPLLMPSVFAGFRVYPGFGLKVQYYLNDFFNHDYQDGMLAGNPHLPYRNLEAKMFFVTLNYDFGKVNYHHHKGKHSRSVSVDF